MQSRWEWEAQKVEPALLHKDPFPRAAAQSYHCLPCSTACTEPGCPLPGTSCMAETPGIDSEELVQHKGAREPHLGGGGFLQHGPLACRLGALPHPAFSDSK